MRMRQAEDCLAVVRRGCEAVFDTLRAEFGAADAVEVIWDRRAHERRRVGLPVSADLRRGERRAGLAPSRWETLGFLLVGRPDAAGS
jgi:hypothetical protein